ncbi:MAG: TolC family protein [Phycisphaerales bacterium]|jgi:outer membrane protein TolC|nr:TolC family protein [Phycisphaerales bacterium]
MDILRSPRCARALAPALGAAACLLAGCQGYERAPIDLAQHRARIDARAGESEPVLRFLDRLGAAGSDVPEAFDLSDGLTPAEGEVLALFYNADLRLARLDAGVALANAENAGLWKDPEFGFDAAEVLSPAGVFEQGLMVILTIPVSGRLEVEKDRASAAYEAELRKLVDAEWSIRARVRAAWSAWSVAEERLGLLRGVITHVERVASITDRLEAAGELTRVEARLIRVELVSLRGQHIAAERAARTARIELLGLMGLPPDARVDLRPDIASPRIPVIEDEVQRLIEANTTLAAQRAAYHVAEETLRLEIRNQYPDITIGTGYGSEGGDDRLLLGFSVPIPILNANRAEIADARARRETARAVVETTFERLARELATARGELDGARRQYDAYEGELKPMLEQQSMEVERLADLGEVDTLLLLDTVTRAYDAGSTLLDLRLAEARAAIEVARLLGPERAMVPAPVRESNDERTRASDAEGDTTQEAAS